jgi:hypothetical protein
MHPSTAKSESAEPQYLKNRRNKVNASGIVPVEKRKAYQASTRCDCPFQITFRKLQKKDISNKSVVLTASCIYKHDKSCFPSRAQLKVEKTEVRTAH